MVGDVMKEVASITMQIVQTNSINFPVAEYTSYGGNFRCSITGGYVIEALVS